MAVTVKTDHRVNGRVAISVYAFASEAAAKAAGFACESGPATPIYVVTAAELAAGTFVQEGDPKATPIYPAPAGMATEGGYATPVVIAGGSLSNSVAVYSFNFDQGSATSIDATDPANVQIVPLKTVLGKWGWYAIKHTNLAGQTPHFSIAKADHFNMVSGEWLACWSTAADSDTWTQFDHVTIGATDLEFYNDNAFPSGTIYISAAPMYPFSRTQRKMATWLAHAYVSDTASSTDGIIGYSTARDDGTGRIAPSLPFYGFKVSSGAGTKNKIVLTSGNHGPEGQGRFALEAAIDWLLAGSAQAKFLLDYCDFYVYPALNGQGIYNGIFRGDAQAPTVDHNRRWDTTGTYEDIDTYKTALSADTGGTIESGIDFHGDLDVTTVYMFSVNNTDTNVVAYAAEVTALDAGFGLVANAETETLQYLFRNTLSAGLNASPECGLSTTRGVAQWRTYGENLIKGVVGLLAKGYLAINAGVGSRNFNGTTDRIDWDNILNTAGQPITFSAWVYPDRVNTNQYFLSVHNSTNTAYASLFSSPGYVTGPNGQLQRLKGGATAYNHFTAEVLVASGWRHVLVTDDGVMTDLTHTHIYLNGVEQAETGGQNGATETAGTGKWSIGGRIYDDTRNLDGRLAQVRVFNRVLTPAEIVLEAAGIVTTTSGLIFNFKGNTADLHETVANALGVADGTTQLTGVGNGPGIIYP